MGMFQNQRMLMNIWLLRTRSACNAAGFGVTVTTTRVCCRRSISNWSRSLHNFTTNSRQIIPMAETLCGREWEYSSLGQQYFKSRKKFAGVEFSIMCYNILAQSLLQENSYLYTNSNPRDLIWNNRRYRLLQELRFYNPDIVCLQEVERIHFNIDLKNVFESMGYTCVFHCRTGDKNDGCLIMFKNDKFRCELVRQVSYYKQGVAILDRDNVGVVLVLSPVDTRFKSTRLCVATTHLLFNPKRGEIKLAQLASLFAEINDVRSSEPWLQDVPCVICGDFNSLPYSPLYNFVTQGSLDYSKITKTDVSGQEQHRNSQFIKPPLLPANVGINDQCCFVNNNDGDEMFDFGVELKHDLSLASVHQHQCLKNGEPEVTTFHKRAQETVDYIFYTHNNSQTQGSLAPLARLSLMCGDDLQYYGGLPNRLQPSDHIPLFSSFLLSPKCYTSPR